MQQKTISKNFFSKKMNQQTASSIQYNRWVQPLSMDEPTKFDNGQTEKITKILRDNNSFPSKKDSEQREAVLAKLDIIIQNWVKEVSVKNVCQEFLEHFTNIQNFIFCRVFRNN